jgi:hypothetical protein
MVNRFLSWRLKPLLDFLRQELHVWLSMVLVIVLVPVARGEISGAIVKQIDSLWLELDVTKFIELLGVLCCVCIYIYIHILYYILYFNYTYIYI